MTVMHDTKSLVTRTRSGTSYSNGRSRRQRKVKAHIEKKRPDVDENEQIDGLQDVNISQIWLPFSMSTRDPFSSTAACVVPMRLLEIQMSDTRQNLLTMVTTKTNDPRAVEFADSIMGFMRDSETTLTSVTAAAMMYWRIARGNDDSRYQAELTASGRALHLLSRAMSCPVTAVTEANIWAVLAMSYCGGGELLRLRTGKLPRRSFLRELQSLHVYGRLRPNDAHVAGLLRLTGMLGGIHKIKTYGIAQIMSYCAILESTRHIIKPGLPFIPYTNSSILDGRIAMQPEEWSDAVRLTALGKGFHPIWHSCGDMTELKSVIANLCSFTVIVDNYVEGRGSYRQASQITDARNFTQFALMKLPAESDYSDGTALDVQYESARIACIVYSYLIVMPIPPVIGLYERISDTLRSAIEKQRLPIKSMEQPRKQLHLWILMMGAVITTGLASQDWFVTQISRVVGMLKINDWQCTHTILQTFLWHPATNEADGVEVWTLSNRSVARD